MVPLTGPATSRTRQAVRRARPSWSRRRWFHSLRLAFWVIQIPPAIAIQSIRESVPYLVFLSLAALVESSATDVDNARAAERRGEEAVPTPAGADDPV